MTEELKPLQNTKIAVLGRVYLGRELMKAMDVQEGDSVLFYQDPRDGRFYVEKIVPSIVNRPVQDCATSG